MAFVLKYPESNGRTDGADPWSIRQTGVYQSFNIKSESALWILLNPRHGNAADERVRHMLHVEEPISPLHCQPPLVGLVVLSRFLMNWRSYMAYYEEEELGMVGSTFYNGVFLPTLPLSQSRVVISATIDEELQVSHSTLSGLRRIEARVLLLPPIFRSLTHNIQILEAFNDALQTDSSTSNETNTEIKELLHNYATMVAAYNSNAVYLLDKIRGTAQLLADTLNLKHQQTAEHVSSNTLALNNAAVKDSATIRVITVVTLV